MPPSPHISFCPKPALIQKNKRWYPDLSHNIHSIFCAKMNGGEREVASVKQTRSSLYPSHQSYPKVTLKHRHTHIFVPTCRAMRQLAPLSLSLKISFSTEIRNVPGGEGLLYTSAPDHVRETSPVGSGPLFPSHQEKVRQEPAFSSFTSPLPLPLLSFTNPPPLAPLPLPLLSSGL